MLVYPQESSFRATVFEELIPTLKKKSEKIKVKKEIQENRTSKFIEAEYQLVTRMLTGEQTVIEQENNDKNMRNEFSQPGKINMNAS